MSEKELEQNIEKVECSDEELEQVAGGAMYLEEKSGKWFSDCKCIMGGGGTGDEYQKTCACIVGGGGEMTAAGEEKFGSGTASVCVLAGASHSNQRLGQSGFKEV